MPFSTNTLDAKYTTPEPAAVPMFRFGLNGLTTLAADLPLLVRVHRGLPAPAPRRAPTPEAQRHQCEECGETDAAKLMDEINMCEDCILVTFKDEVATMEREAKALAAEEAVTEQDPSGASTPTSVTPGISPACHQGEQHYPPSASTDEGVEIPVASEHTQRNAAPLLSRPQLSEHNVASPAGTPLLTPIHSPGMSPLRQLLSIPVTKAFDNESIAAWAAEVTRAMMEDADPDPRSRRLTCRRPALSLSVDPEVAYAYRSGYHIRHLGGGRYLITRRNGHFYCLQAMGRLLGPDGQPVRVRYESEDEDGPRGRFGGYHTA